MQDLIAHGGPRPGAARPGRPVAEAGRRDQRDARHGRWSRWSSSPPASPRKIELDPRRPAGPTSRWCSPGATWPATSPPCGWSRCRTARRSTGTTTSPPCAPRTARRRSARNFWNHQGLADDRPPLGRRGRRGPLHADDRAAEGRPAEPAVGAVRAGPAARPRRPSTSTCAPTRRSAWPPRMCCCTSTQLLRRRRPQPRQVYDLLRQAPARQARPGGAAGPGAAGSASTSAG